MRDWKLGYVRGAVTGAGSALACLAIHDREWVALVSVIVLACMIDAGCRFLIGPETEAPHGR